MIALCQRADLGRRHPLCGAAPRPAPWLPLPSAGEWAARLGLAGGLVLVGALVLAAVSVTAGALLLLPVRLCGRAELLLPSAEKK